MSFSLITTTGEYTWYDTNNKPNVSLNHIVLFAADGHELEIIRQRLPNVPITLGGHCRWRGEMAQFIYENL